MTTKAKATAADESGKPATITLTPGIDDPWGRLAAAARAFGHKATTHPEVAPDLLAVGEILAHLPDPDFRAKVVRVLRRYLGTGRHGLAYRQAQHFAHLVKVDMLAGTLEEAARSVLRVLEASPLLWGRSGQLVGAGPKRPASLDLETVEEALKRAHEDATEIRADLEAAQDPEARTEAHRRFAKAIDGDALARKVLLAVKVDPGWVYDLYE